jgi:hypothetical protein
VCFETFGSSPAAEEERIFIETADVSAAKRTFRRDVFASRLMELVQTIFVSVGRWHRHNGGLAKPVGGCARAIDAFEEQLRLTQALPPGARGQRALRYWCRVTGNVAIDCRHGTQTKRRLLRCAIAQAQTGQCMTSLLFARPFAISWIARRRVLQEERAEYLVAVVLRVRIARVRRWSGGAGSSSGGDRFWTMNRRRSDTKEMPVRILLSWPAEYRLREDGG